MLSPQLNLQSVGLIILFWDCDLFMRKCVRLHIFSRICRWSLGRKPFALLPGYMIRLAFCAVALGSTEPEPDCFESQQTTLLQHGLQVTSLARQDQQAGRAPFRDPRPQNHEPGLACTAKHRCKRATLFPLRHPFRRARAQPVLHGKR